ncbi:MAG: hypothetical protein RI925_1065 [Pseudomonadota bacterium]|jgi:uncharacterized protein (DUF2235 family)
MHRYPQQLANGEAAPQIYVLGFSRGAFTARAVAGLVNQFGLLQPQIDNMVTTLVHGYFSQRHEGDTRLKEIAEQLRTLFGTTPRQVPVQFVGVWDTVAAVGMPPFTTRFSAEPRAAGKAFVHVRQALAWLVSEAVCCGSSWRRCTGVRCKARISTPPAGPGASLGSWPQRPWPSSPGCWGQWCCRWGR